MGSVNTFRMQSTLAVDFCLVGTSRGHLECRPGGFDGHIENTWCEHILNVCHMPPTWAHCDQNASDIYNVTGGHMMVKIWEHCEYFIDLSMPDSTTHIGET